MGIGERLRRLRGERRVMPDPGSPEFEAAVRGSALPGSTEMGQEGWASVSAPPAGAQPVAGGQVPAVTPEALVAAGLPAEHAQRAAAVMAQLRQGSHTLNLQGLEGLRDEMREVMRRHGVDPDSGVALDASSVPGLQEALLGVLARHGVDTSRYSGR